MRISAFSSLFLSALRSHTLIIKIKNLYTRNIEKSLPHFPQKFVEDLSRSTGAFFRVNYNPSVNVGVGISRMSPIGSTAFNFINVATEGGETNDDGYNREDRESDKFY